jgi:hypothetical protein
MIPGTDAKTQGGGVEVQASASNHYSRMQWLEQHLRHCFHFTQVGKWYTVISGPIVWSLRLHVIH